MLLQVAARLRAEHELAEHHWRIADSEPSLDRPTLNGALSGVRSHLGRRALRLHSPALLIDYIAQHQTSLFCDYDQKRMCCASGQAKPVQPLPNVDALSCAMVD
jgi:hypothetical protein